MTEEPDAPMPMCMSPESYRAEITRRKSAERERDDLAKQAERLIEENEKLTANVATLVEQLGEAERRATELRGLIVRMADQTRSDVNALEASDDMGHRRSVAERARYDLRRVVEQVASAGAAQPVVEPRDETSAETRDHDRLLAVAYAFNRWANASWSQKEALDAIGEALGDPFSYDAEHGYAPHPSGTEGPLREALSKVNDIIIAPDALKNPCATIARIEDVVDRALAASPPDGTAPERAPTDPDDEVWLGGGTLGDLKRHDPATRPPDGMPGEPASCCPKCTKDHYDEGEWATRPHRTHRCVDDRAGKGCGHEWADAAPPTVPGEPPSHNALQALAQVSQWTRVHGAALKPMRADTYGEGMREAKCQVAAILSAWRTAPPTPPLTPERAPADAFDTIAEHVERMVFAFDKDDSRRDDVRKLAEWIREHRRAPLDEAAVRADERRRTERDIAEWLNRASQHPSRLRMSLHDASRMIDVADYPRRSEGAG